MKALALLCSLMMVSGCAEDLDTSPRSWCDPAEGWDGVKCVEAGTWRFIEAREREDGKFDVKVGFSVMLENVTGKTLGFAGGRVSLLDDSGIALFKERIRVTRRDDIFLIGAGREEMYSETFHIRVNSLESLSDIAVFKLSAEWRRPK